MTLRIPDKPTPADDTVGGEKLATTRVISMSPTTRQGAASPFACEVGSKKRERGGGVYINNDLTRAIASDSPPTNFAALSADDGFLALTLPWPPTALSPNTRHAHWAQLAAAKRRYRAACAITAQAQGARPLAGKFEALAVNLRFVPPDRRLRDLDNCIASMKSGLDGLADVLQVDDNRWRLSAEMVAGEIGGMVRVEVVACRA